MAVDDSGARTQGITVPLIGGEQAVPSEDNGWPLQARRQRGL